MELDWPDGRVSVLRGFLTTNCWFYMVMDGWTRDGFSVQKDLCLWLLGNVFHSFHWDNGAVCGRTRK